MTRKNGRGARADVTRCASDPVQSTQWGGNEKPGTPLPRGGRG